MKPQTIGRVLGIGVRVAGRVAGECLESATQPAPSQSSPASLPGQSTIRRAAQTTGSITRGVGGFLRPFRRVGAVLWLEVTGAFFLLPVVVFSPMLWKTRADWAHGPDHLRFVSAAVVVAVFLYLGLSSFWRAHRRAKVM